jgi:hypothetical protein
VLFEEVLKEALKEVEGCQDRRRKLIKVLTDMRHDDTFRGDYLLGAHRTDAT